MFRRFCQLASLCGLLYWAVAGPALAASRGIEVQPLAPASELATGTYRALVIGNNRYQDPEQQWLPLKTAISDAEALATLLESDFGFVDVTLMKDATRREILLALRQLAQRVAPDDSVLLYYAGHGFLDPESERGFWVPVDAVGQDHTTFVRNSTIRDELSIIAQRARHTLLLSDSCFSGTLLRDGQRGLSPSSSTATAYYQKMAEKRSAQIIAAGGVEYVDDDYRGSGHSPFTYFLLNELRTSPEPIITATQLGAQVSQAVANNVQQVPESGVLYGAGDELGEFLFIRTTLATGPVTTATSPPIATEPSPPKRQKEPVKPVRPNEAMVPMPVF